MNKKPTREWFGSIKMMDQIYLTITATILFISYVIMSVMISFKLNKACKLAEKHNEKFSAIDKHTETFQLHTWIKLSEIATKYSDEDLKKTVESGKSLKGWRGFVLFFLILLIITLILKDA